MFKRILFFYIDGFKNLSDLGKKLWVIIIIKLVVIFVVLKVFFFPTLDSKIKGEKEKANLYLNQLTKITKQTKEE
jgi:flagellar basal body-associated protein FliL